MPVTNKTKILERDVGKEKADCLFYFFFFFPLPHERFNLKAPPPRESCNVETFLVKFHRPTHLLSPSRCNFFLSLLHFFLPPLSLSLSPSLLPLPRSTGRSENLVLLNYPPPMDRCKCTRADSFQPFQLLSIYPGKSGRNIVGRNLSHDPSSSIANHGDART